jgi:hypothetical protein
VAELTLSLDCQVLQAAVDLLGHVEAVPGNGTGALSFGDDGVILLQNRRICWAVAADMQTRLTDLLCEQKDPPLPRHAMEALFRRCKESGTPIGEALVSGGFLSQVELRAALGRHSGEAIGRIARARTRPTGFTPHTKSGYDPRFVFGAAEALALLSAGRDGSAALLAGEHLHDTLVPGASGFAFVRDRESGTPVLLAVDPACELRVSETLEIGTWSSRIFDVTTFFDPATSVASATWCGRTSVVTWRVEQVSYVAVCVNRPASTLLVNQLAKRTRDAGHAPRLASNPGW